PADTFRRDREHSLNRRKRLWVSASGVPHERPDRREPRVAGAWAVPSGDFEMIEEAQDQRGIEVAHGQRRRRLLQLSFGELKEEPECIPVAFDGPRTRGALLEEAQGKVVLKQLLKG